MDAHLERTTMTTTIRAGRNDACPCGSGKKYKKCCEAKQHSSRSNMMMLIIVGLLMAGGLAAGISSFMSDKDVARPGGVWSAEHGHYH
jgi:cobalamin biosynthesis Mg chelatase CobN